MNLLGDAVHNFVDGILIAGSFAADTKLGIITTVAIIVHEIPQELGDVGALIAGGYPPSLAVRLNFYCALTVILGVLATLAFEQVAAASLAWLLPVAAGSFIYIAACDFIPYLHASDQQSNAWTQSLGFGFGIVAMHAAVLFEGLERSLLRSEHWLP
jgi:zinc and cadmium transporter